MTSVRDIRAGHGRSPHEGPYRLSIWGDTHFFRLRLGLWDIVLGQGFQSRCCRRSAGLLDDGFRSHGPHVAVLVEFLRSRVAIPREVASDIESCIPLIFDWET